MARRILVGTTNPSKVIWLKGYLSSLPEIECVTLNDLGVTVPVPEEGKTPEEMLAMLLDGLDLVITDTRPCRFHCNCDKRRVEKAIISIGRKDIEEMINEGKGIEVNCQFCNSSYRFTVEELKDMLKRAR